MMVGWRAGRQAGKWAGRQAGSRQACRPAGRSVRAQVCFNKEHKELKLTCTMIASRENPLRDYIHNMIRLWNCMESGDKEQSGR